MGKVRLIPRLDIKGPNLVKGIHLEGLRVLGEPKQFARYYYENGADELIYQDVVASLFERNSLHELISETAKEVFIPLTVGGGIRTLDDIKRVLRAGADKVSLNTAAIKNPQIITDASRKFGSSTIVVAIEAIKDEQGQYLAYVDNGREHTGVEVVSWAQRVEEMGAGEILITSVDKEGTGEGFDVELTRKISEAVSIPVIAHGGAGSPQDITQVIQDADVDGVSFASILHYGYIAENETDRGSDQEGNTEFLKKKKAFGKINPSGLDEVRKHMLELGISTREIVAAE